MAKKKQSSFCGQCRFWEEVEDQPADEPIKFGGCHRYPPAESVHLENLMELLPDDMEPAKKMERGCPWPVTRADAWCGEWRPRP